MGNPSISFTLFSAILLFSVLWKPAYTDDKCSIGCVGSPSSPSFLNGHKYNYGVEGTVSVYLTDADKQSTKLKILGQVSVSVPGNCVHVLKVQNLAISGPDGKKYGKPNGLEKPVRFTLQDGRVGAEICAEEGDTRRSLNIKRAIISLLQTEQKTSTQVDIFGACPTEVSSSQEGAALLVHRSRDLSRCAHREQARNDVFSAVANPHAEIKDTQVLQSTLNVESKVNNGVPEKIVASESYLYKPFSVGENGARASVETKLTLTGKSAGGENGKCTVLRTIIFENPQGASNDQSNLQSSLAILKETAKNLATEANSKSAGSFVQLIRAFRVTSKDDLLKIYNNVKGSKLEKRVYLDALLRSGTANSIEVSIQLLKSKDLSPLEAELVFLSLGNARQVNASVLKAAASLLDQPNIPKETYLGVGALAGIYCRKNNCHLNKDDGIVALSNKLGAKIQKPKNKVEEDNVVAVLKGIRNIRHLEDNLVDKISHLAADNGAKNRLRAAALEAFLSDPCASKLKRTALDLLKNRQLDSEIRIKAYLAIIACPCAKSANEIATLLESEPVHQVGRFISTSLIHIRNSANPDKLNAKLHYGNIRTPNKFKIDDRKYSFYREGSFNIDALGIGGSAEETVIYSQDSFLPRSAALNLTAEVFGHNLNVLEIGGRQGNLDRIVEHFLGPKSILRTKTPQQIYENILERYHEAKSKVEHGVRGRRSVKSEIDNFDKHVKAESAPFNNELDLDIYLKLFGTDALFLSLGDEKGLDFNRILDQVLKTVEGGFQQLKHFQHEIRTNLLFLDAELAYPTSTGLPLKLELIGAATARLDVSSNVDIRSIIRNPENAKIDIKIVPSTDIEISGLFVIDADVVSTGLKVVTNLHSSTGSHLIAKVLENGRGIDIQLGLPVDKQEIITASNDLIFVTTEKGQKSKEIEVKVDVDRKEYSGCFDQLSGLLGLTLCGELSVPFSVSGPEAQASLAKYFSRYPLLGATKVRLALEKNDIKGYHIKGVWKKDGADRNSFELLFDPEGSQNRRTQVTGELVFTEVEKTVKLGLVSPIKSVSAELSLLNKPTELAAVAQAKLGDSLYYGRVGFNVQGNEQRKVYKAVVEYELPDNQGKQNLKVDGQAIREVNGQSVKYTFNDIKINIPNSNEVIDVNGFYSEDPNGREGEVKAKKGDQNLQLSGSLRGHAAYLEFRNTLNPFINFKINGVFETENTIRNEWDLYYGGDLNDQRQRVTINQVFKSYTKTAEEFSVITKNRLEIHALPFKLKLDAEVDPKKIDFEFEGQYLDKKAELNLEARTKIKKAGDYSLKANAAFDKKGFELFAKRDIVNADKSNFENYIVIKSVGKYELSGVVLHKNKPGDINFGAIGHLKITDASGKGEDVKFDIGALENNNQYASHAQVAYSKGEILDFLLKITKGHNASGQLRFVVAASFSVSGQFKVTDSDGKGNGFLIIGSKKADRRIKVDVKFLVKEPIYNADIDVYLNFEKDNNDKIHITTQTKKTDKNVDSKNKLTYGGQNFEVTVHHDGGASFKTHTKVEIVLPTERVLGFKVDRDLKEQKDTWNGHAEIALTDAPKRGAAGSSISYKSKIVNTNWEKETIDYEGNFEVKLQNGKDLVNTILIKNVPVNENRAKFNLKYEVSGNVIPEKFIVVLDSDLTKGSVLDFKDTYDFRANYGNLGFEYAGVWEVLLLENGDKKYLDDGTVTFRLPFEKTKELKFVVYVLYLQPLNGPLEYTFTTSTQINADLYKGDITGKVLPYGGAGKLKLAAPREQPISIDYSYDADYDSNDKKTAKFDLKTLYGKGKSSHIAFEAITFPHEHIITFKINAPQSEHVKKLDINMNHKFPTPDTHTCKGIIEVDGNIYKPGFSVIYSKAHPLLEFSYGSPTSPDSRFYIKGTSLSSTYGKLEIKGENIRGDLNFDVVSESNIQKDNVAVKILANAEKLGWKNYKVDITTKDAGSGKRLEFYAVNDNKNILSGSTTFIGKTEGQKSIIEGSGSVKYLEEQKSANFKYIRTLLTEGNEQGVETFLNLAIGERSYVAESRITNLEYKNSYLYCEEKKQCANAELHSKVNTIQPGVFQHLLKVDFDLRKLGFAPEFGLEITNEFSEKRLPQYKLDLHVNKEDRKYYLHSYFQPEFGSFPAGITVTLPQRVLALEGLLTYSTNNGFQFPIKGSIVLDLDKNKGNQKSAIRVLIDASHKNGQCDAITELGLTHPKLGKEFTVKLRGNYAYSQSHVFKVETSAVASHQLLGHDREGKFLVQASPSSFKFLLNTPMVKVIDLEASGVNKEKLQEGNVKFALLEGKPVTIKALAKDYQYFEFTTGYTDESERKLSVIGNIIPDKRVDISADIVLGGDKKNIAHGAIFLKDGLVKTDYSVSKDNVKYFVNAFNKDLNNLDERVKALADKASADVKSTLKRVEPTLKEVAASYEEELKKLNNELANDKVLKEIGGAIEKLSQFFAKFINEILVTLKPLTDVIASTASEISQKSAELYEKQIEPQLKELYATIATALKEYLNALIDVVAHFGALAADLLEKHKPQFEELLNNSAATFKDLTRIIISHLKEIRVRLVEILGDWTKDFKEVPVLNILKEKWQELAVPEQLLALLQKVHELVYPLLPNEETKKFGEALFSYVSKKIRNEKVDDAKELRIVYERFAATVASLLQLIRGQVGTVGAPALLNFNNLPFFSGLTGFSAPGITSPPSVSILNQILWGDVPDPLSLLRAYRPRSLNPLDEVPAKLRAVVVNGQHIFTFDGRHLTYPGSCRYVLAHDHVDRNFTLAIQLQNGNPKALILEDQSGTVLELKDNGQAHLNGANHGFPIIEKDVFAFRQANGRIGLGSLYGLMAFCTSKLEVCYIEVNGFYLGKLRGLLGDGNNEPFDDFRLPNGRIANTEAEFGHAYRLAGSCPQAKVPEHSHHQHHSALPEACEQVFGGSSPLRPLGLVLDIAPFRQACIHAVGSDSAHALQQACDLGRGYAALAVTGLLPAVLPAVCVQCNDADTPKNVGDTYELKVPNKKADLVIVFDTTEPTEEIFKKLTVPLVSQLVDSLKAKHIDDVKVYLVGITSKYPYPIIYDTDPKLQKAKVHFDDATRYGIPTTLTTGIGNIDDVLEFFTLGFENLKIQLSLTNVARSYAAVSELPYRAGSVKHLIAVVGEKCRPLNIFTSLGHIAAYEATYGKAAWSHSIITPTPELTDTQIVAFTEDAAIKLGEKKITKEAGARRDTFDLSANACIDFIEGTDGLVISASNYKSLDAGHQKEFISTAAAALTNMIQAESSVQECICVYADPFRVRSVCVSKEKKEASRRRK